MASPKRHTTKTSLECFSAILWILRIVIILLLREIQYLRKRLASYEKTPPIPINHLHRMTTGKDDTNPHVALPAESRAAKKVIRAMSVSWHCQAKSLKPFITSHNSVSTADSLSPNLTRVSPLKNDRYGKSRKSNHRLSNMSSIEQLALADTKTALTSLN